MSAGSVGSAIETYGKLQDSTTRFTLPDNTSNPTEIEIGGDDCQISLQCESAFDWCLSDSAANAAIKITAGTNHASFPGGLLNLGIAGFAGNEATDLKLYVREQGATGTVVMTTWRHRH